GKTLATAAGRLEHEAGIIKVWSAETGNELYSIRGHDGMITQLGYRPDGKNLVSADVGGDVKEWHLIKNAEMLVINGRGFQRGFNPKTGRLTTVDGETIKVRDLRTGEELRSLALPKDLKTVIHCWDIAGSGQYVMVARGEQITVWDTVLGKAIQE